MATNAWLVRILDPGTEASPARRMIVSSLVMALLCLLCLPFFLSNTATQASAVRNGTISFAGKGPLDRPVLLEGLWDFKWESALGKIRAGDVPLFRMKVPGVWNETRAPDGTMLPQAGVATYGVTVKGLPPGSYRFILPTVFVASEIRIDGKLVSRRGMLGATPQTTRYVWRLQDAGFEADGRDVRIEVRMAAHLHRDNGFDAAPSIGLQEPMLDWMSKRLSQEFLTQIALMTIGFFCLVAFLYRPRDPSFFYFSLASFALMPASLMLGFDNLFTMAFPRVPFATMLALVYLGACVSMTSVLVYVHSIYPAESPKRGFRVTLAIALGFTTVQGASFLIGGTYLASQVDTKLVIVMLTIFFYMLFVIARAVRRNRDGALPFLIGMAVFCTVMTMVGIIASGILPRDTFGGLANASFGILVLLFSHIIVLAERWSRAIGFSEAVADDLRQLLEVNSSITSEIELEALLTRIVEVTSRILRAERSSLFLHDDKTDDLWALVAEGVDNRIVRFPASTGVAGKVFSSGESAMVADAYTDSHFNREVDERSGFKTRNLIAVPIMTREGRRLGVLEALNRLGSAGFDDTDLARMRAFAAQAAIALDNATLFTEVVASRNYNESILRSMSSGVVTLDQHARVAKFNAAASAILRVPEERLQGMDARTALASSNPSLIAEIDAVSETGEPKTLLDLDLVAGDGRPISVNLTIVPLASENEDMGLLILVEDISQGKRLQGAMRRFMPQEVVEEVLGREDDLMFGTSCEASILFADIRNFTGMAEELSPRETVDMLNEIFTDLFEAVAEASGTIDKYMGDAIMAVYGAPLPTGDDAANAVRSAVRMAEMVEALNDRREERGLHRLRIGIGIATGEVVAGTIGSPKRMDYTVVGDSVNLASRLEEATKTYKVGAIICETTAARVDGVAPLRELDLIRVRGRSKPAKIFEILTPGGPPASAVVAYAEGRALLREFDWAGAVATFERACTLAPEDGASALMRDRARAAVSNPPGEDWDGVW